MPREGYMAFFQLAFEKQEEMNQPLVSKNRFPSTIKSQPEIGKDFKLATFFYLYNHLILI